MPSDSDAFKSFELQGWQRVSAHYGDCFGPLTSQVIEPMLELLNVRPGSRLLDVATGPGFLARAAAARGAQVTGVDFAPEMIALARAAAPSLHFEVGDAESLAFPDGSFDAVAMNFGILHLARPETAIQEAARVLIRNGRFAFSCWDLPNQRCGFRTILDAIETHGSKQIVLPSGPSFFHYADPNNAKRALETNGFVEMTVTKLPLVWKLPSAETFFRAFHEGTPRTGGLLRAQPSSNFELIRRAVIESSQQQFACGRNLEILMPAVVLVARRV